jgi:hypothetical protein
MEDLEKMSMPSGCIGSQHIQQGSVGNKAGTWLLSVYVILKPIYLLPSGVPQPADFLLALAAAILLGRAVNEARRLWFIPAFCAFAWVVNTLSAIYLSDMSSILSGVYVIFSLSCVMIVQGSAHFVNWTDVSKACAFSVGVQFLVFILGYGGWMGQSRYQGLMNDPNQFGFMMLYIMILYFLVRSGKRTSIGSCFYAFTCIWLIIQSNSMGAICGVVVIAIIVLIHYCMRHVESTIFLSISACFVVFLDAHFGRISDIFSKRITELIIRQVHKVRDFSLEGVFTEFLQDRGYTTIIKAPQYLLFGAGGGGATSRGLSQVEIHSALFGIWFYYGLGGICLIALFIISSLKLSYALERALIIGALVASLTLDTSRQFLYWLIVGYGIMSSSEKAHARHESLAQPQFLGGGEGESDLARFWALNSKSPRECRPGQSTWEFNLRLAA